MSNTKKTEKIENEVTVVETEKKLKLTDKIKAATERIPAPVRKTVKVIGKIIGTGLAILGAIDVGCSIKEALGNNSSTSEPEEIDGEIE